MLPISFAAGRGERPLAPTLASLLGCISPVARDVEFHDAGVVHHTVNRRGVGHWVGEDALDDQPVASTGMARLDVMPNDLSS